MRAYSQDLRERVMSKYKTGNYTVKELSAMYEISYQTIYNWINRYNETGEYMSRQHLVPGVKRKFDDKELVLEYLSKNPNADGIAIRNNVAPDLAMSTFYDSMNRMGITYKKKSLDINPGMNLSAKNL